LQDSSGGHILDVGAGVGNFLKKLDPCWEPFATEGSDTTRRQLERSGVRVFPDLETAAREESGTFAVITIFQTLEHIAGFRDVLRHCRHLLSPTGRLVITVPDGDAMLLQERLTGLPDMVPNHLNKWTRESLSRALRVAGFETLEVMTEPSSWSNLKKSVHHRLLADAAQHPASVAAQIYRCRHKWLRIGLLAVVAPFTLLRMLPHLNTLRKGGAFGIVSRPHIPGAHSTRNDVRHDAPAGLPGGPPK
jgi:SAM-dependent methyltransferase